MSEHTKALIQRYSTHSSEFDYCELREDKDGDYVLYTDHASELAALRERVKELEEALAGLIMNCEKSFKSAPTITIGYRLKEAMAALGKE